MVRAGGTTDREAASALTLDLREGALGADSVNATRLRVRNWFLSGLLAPKGNVDYHFSTGCGG
jgi:hypothetical protein